jgi:hypothetical protein
MDHTSTPAAGQPEALPAITGLYYTTDESDNGEVRHVVRGPEPPDWSGKHSALPVVLAVLNVALTPESAARYGRMFAGAPVLAGHLENAILRLEDALQLLILQNFREDCEHTIRACRAALADVTRRVPAPVAASDSFARRLRAALAAVEGIPTEALEQGVVADMITGCTHALQWSIRDERHGGDIGTLAEEVVPMLEAALEKAGSPFVESEAPHA